MSHVMKHGSYEVPPQQSVPIIINVTNNIGNNIGNNIDQVNQILNEHNVMNRFLGTMDIMSKVSKYLAYTQKATVDFPDFVSGSYEGLVAALEADDNDDTLDEASIKQMVDAVSTWTTMAEVNLVYDGETDKLRVYNDGVWQQFIMDCGLQKVVEVIKDRVLDYYETSLLKRMERARGREQARLTEHLRELYKFYAAFDMFPWVKDVTDNVIVRDGSKASYRISEIADKVYA